MKSIYFAKQNVHVVLNSGSDFDVATIAAALAKLDLSHLKPGDPCYLGYRPATRVMDSVNAHYREVAAIPEYQMVPEAWYYAVTSDKVYATVPHNLHSVYKSEEWRDYWAGRVAGAFDGVVKHELVGYIYRPLTTRDFVRVNSGSPRIDKNVSYAIQQLIAYKTFSFIKDMGSCHCGNTRAVLTVLPTGLLWVKTTGDEAWQCWEGPAAMCCVSYGVGERCSLLSDVWTGVTPSAGDIARAYC